MIIIHKIRNNNSCRISSRSKHRTLSACHPHALFQLICLPQSPSWTQNTHYPHLCLRSVLPDFELQIIYLCVSIWLHITQLYFYEDSSSIDGHPGYFSFWVLLVMMLWISLYVHLGEHMCTYLLSTLLVKLLDCRHAHVPFEQLLLNGFST